MKTNFPPNGDAQSLQEKLTNSRRDVLFAPALYYKVDRTTNSRHFWFPSKNITQAMPHMAFGTNRSHAQHAPYGPIEMSITPRPLTANAPQEAETGHQ